MTDALLQNPATEINAGPLPIAGHGAGEPGAPFRGILWGVALSAPVWAGIFVMIRTLNTQ